MKRRAFLKTMSWAASAAALGPILPGAPALAQGGGREKLIVLFLRGGLDGLSALAPVEEGAYFQARPTIAIPPPGREGGALPLAPGFGLHPALEPLLEPWRAGTLALIPACGLQTPIRTHPEAQRAMESGQPGERHFRDGWLARLMPLIGKDAQAITLSANPPLIGQGRPGAQNIKPSGHQPSVWPIERPEAFKAFDAVYKGQDALSRAYQQSQITLRNRLTEMDREIAISSSGAPSIHALPSLGAQIAAYMERNPAVRLVYAALGGIDAHFAQGASKGRLAEVFVSLGKGLAGLARALGPSFYDTTILVMSEFGRSLRENEFGGTENGHGTLFMLLGGRVAGGALHGPWPGLSPAKLSDGLDLAVSVDFRDVIASIVMDFFGLSKEQAAQVLPGHAPAGTLKLLRS